MSDALGRLALRALGKADGIRPRLVGRFEGTQRAVPVEPETIAAAPASPPGLPLPPPASIVAAPAPLPAIPVPSRAPSQAAATVQRKASPAAEIVRPTAAPTPARTITPLVSPEAPRPAPVRAAVPSARPTRRPLPAPLLVEPASAAPSVPMRGDRPATRTAAVTAPDIQVSIGRIEVRADPAALRRPASAPRPSPFVSLEDYLGRSGGRR